MFLLGGMSEVMGGKLQNAKGCAPRLFLVAQTQGIDQGLMRLQGLAVIGCRTIGGSQSPRQRGMDDTG